MKMDQMISGVELRASDSSFLPMLAKMLAAKVMKQTTRTADGYRLTVEVRPVYSTTVSALYCCVNQEGNLHPRTIATKRDISWTLLLEQPEILSLDEDEVNEFWAVTKMKGED